MSGAFGKTIKEQNIENIFLTGPGEMLVANTLMQMASIQNASGAAFTQLFGPYVPLNDQQRWADYSRFDWSIRQLPAINVYEAEPQDKTSSNAWVNGNISIMVLWAPNQRRSDLARVQMAFNGALQNFFESQQVVDMLDELYWIERPAKVPGLNEYGKIMNWSPNVEGLVEDQMVPVTLVNVKYRLDLRAWYRWLEFQNRTKLAPYFDSLSQLTVIGGDYAGVIYDDGTGVQVEIPDEIDVSNPPPG
jgi:hypothetical protein